jgi:hypothetical protein
MSLGLFNKRGVDFCPRRRIVLQSVKQRFAIFPPIFVEVSNIIQRPKKSLELIFISDNIKEFASKFNSSINGTNLSFRNVKTKESNLGLE